MQLIRSTQNVSTFSFFRSHDDLFLAHASRIFVYWPLYILALVMVIFFANWAERVIKFSKETLNRVFNVSWLQSTGMYGVYVFYCLKRMRESFVGEKLLFFEYFVRFDGVFNKFYWKIKICCHFEFYKDDSCWLDIMWHFKRIYW